ncbi:unnamed protein product [Lymnaea stagnalis]|uniref:Uncharacterized protein n=1 Tax=Lymnaea stagnalis TaxID=6523 RepID=A0AAV2GZY1_LYMST
MSVELNMPEAKHYDTKSKVAVLTWLTVVSAVGIIKIVVGSLNVNDGCIGLSLLPYYFLIGGILALLPAVLAFLTSCLGQTQNLQEIWDLMAKVFAGFLLLIIVGTVYLLTSAVRVTGMDRLCTHTWVPILGICIIAADWLTVVFFYRLFCVHEHVALPEGAPVLPFQHESPFHLWKIRQHRRLYQ